MYAPPLSFVVAFWLVCFAGGTLKHLYGVTAVASAKRAGYVFVDGLGAQHMIEAAIRAL
jgi:hypothetical protein